MTVRAVIGGRDVSRDDILAWEAKRLPRAARRIGLPVPSGDLVVQRLAFADAKLALGPMLIRRRLARQLRVSDVIGRVAAGATGGRRSASVCDLFATSGDAATFVAWFADDRRADYERSMLAANPDHFLIATAHDNRQEVIETTGGSPLPTQFFVDYADSSTLRTPRDPDFPVALSGVALARPAAAIGGVRHQFRDTEDGLHARLTVEFPATMPGYLIRAHRWHLAVEFANWIEFAFASG